MSTNIKYNQQMLSNAVESLVNAEAAVMAHLKWIGEKKRLAVIDRIKDSTYKAYNLTSGDWRERGIDPAAQMKPINVDVSFANHNIVNRVKENKKENWGGLITLSITFMQDPEVFLGSKKKLTDVEKKLLKDLKRIYDNGDIHYNRNEKICEINSTLRDLKHNINVVIYAQWSFTLDTILTTDFLLYGLRTDKIDLW